MQLEMRWSKGIDELRESKVTAERMAVSLSRVSVPSWGAKEEREKSWGTKKREREKRDFFFKIVACKSSIQEHATKDLHIFQLNESRMKFGNVQDLCAEGEMRYWDHHEVYPRC